MADYSISIDAAGSAKNNERDRSISGLFSYTGGTYKTISRLTRRGGIWCNCGGTSQSVTLAVYDQLLDGATVIKTSDTVTCKCYGTGPSADNYAQTTFSNWTQAESNAATAAWAAGTLIVRRFVTIKAYTSSNHGSPVFRDGQYSDVIAIQGSTVPFTQYRPVIALFDVFRSDDGATENPESTSVYAKIRLKMNDSTGLADSPKLRVYYAQDTDPSTASSYLDIGSTFGLSAGNLNKDKVVKLTGTWSNGADYYFLLYFSAGYEVADGRLDMAPRAAIPIYISENNMGVSIGQYSSATKDAPKFESRWPAYLYGGIARIGDGWTTLNPATGSTPADYGGGALRCRAMEKLRVVDGSILVTPGSSAVVLATLPGGYTPGKSVFSMNACSGARLARIAVGGTGDTYAGKLCLEWVKNLSDGSNYTSTAIWVQCSIYYWVD